ncbi:hypothetical protein EVAR_49911_1 [Eumeta japonica]|uniref:Uncharacterized protein n=1 Tax=Eumeta variegata TaxID=151549 RepID=A0A4C1Y544_EUMVA|nr:hypothetical protein EVAR_49911_1 [Eumeta japonica]
MGSRSLPERADLLTAIAIRRRSSRLVARLNQSPAKYNYDMAERRMLLMMLCWATTVLLMHKRLAGLAPFHPTKRSLTHAAVTYTGTNYTTDINPPIVSAIIGALCLARTCARVTSAYNER